MKSKIDKITVDFRLREEKNGIELVNNVRQLTQRNIPALIITGDTSTDQLKKIRSSGLPYLHKPVDVNQLYNFLNLK